MTIEQIYSLFRSSKGICTDTRKLEKGEIFLALSGENFDGNTYAEIALDKGASYVIVKKDSAFSHLDDSRLIIVEDTLKTLQDLANYHRHNVLEARHLPVLALTGTNGKTTTKELIYRVLSSKYRVIATEGNLNNDIGVPLSLLKIKSDTDIAIIEMGANHPDDIANLVKIVEPDMGLITNVGKAHLQGFLNFEGVCKAKAKLYDYLIEHSRLIFANHDDANLQAMLKERNAKLLEYYGIEYNDVQILETDMEHPFLRLSMNNSSLSSEGKGDNVNNYGADFGGLSGKRHGRIIVNTNLIGEYNTNNVLAALVIARHFNVNMDDAVSAISSYYPQNNRSQLLKTEYNTLIVDAYNANPSSMSLALANFQKIEHKHKIVCIGAMGELGNESNSEHMKILDILLSMDVEKILLVGQSFCQLMKEKSPNILCFFTSDDLKKYLETQLIRDSLILIKGSRSTKMENIISVL